MVSNKHQTDYDVIIAGGGIAGLATAVALIRAGITNIVLYEKAMDLQPVGAAIGLFPNGFAALEAISPNVARKCRESSIRHTLMRMYDASNDGALLSETDMTKVKMTTPTYLVWYLLQRYLAEEVEELSSSSSSSVIRLGHVVESYQVDEDTGLVTVVSKSRTTIGDSKSEEHKCRILIGADGIHSSIRSQMIENKDHPKQYHGKLMFRAVMDIDMLDEGTIPKAGIQVGYRGDVKGQLFAFRETAKGIMTFTSMAVFDVEDGSNPDDLLMPDAASKKKRLQDLFQGYPKAVCHILDRVPANAIFENVIYDIDVVSEWSSGPVVLIGDAAHATTPGIGQGANIGLEDACEVAHAIAAVLKNDNDNDSSSSADKVGSDVVSKALTDFWRLRFDRVNQIHAVSRATTNQNNQSDKNSKMFGLLRDPKFTDMMYNWKPSFVGDGGGGGGGGTE